MIKTPTEILRKEHKGISITWSDKQVVFLNSELLRKNCPCAECRENRGDNSHSKPLGQHPATRSKKLLTIVENTKEEQLTLRAIRVVGNYAIGIEWADGHHAGIYTFQYLNELCEKIQEIRN